MPFTDLPPKPTPEDAILAIDASTGQIFYRWPPDFTYGWPPVAFDYTVTTTYPPARLEVDGVFVDTIDDWTYTWRLDADVPHIAADAFILWSWQRISGETLPDDHFAYAFNNRTAWASLTAFDNPNLTGLDDLIVPNPSVTTFPHTEHTTNPALLTGWIEPGDDLGGNGDHQEPRFLTDWAKLQDNSVGFNRAVFHPWERAILTAQDLPKQLTFLFQAYRQVQGPLFLSPFAFPPVYTIGGTQPRPDEMTWQWVDHRCFIVPIYFSRRGQIVAEPGAPGARRRTRVIGSGSEPATLRAGADLAGSAEPGSLNATPGGGGVRRDPPAFWLPGDVPDA